MKYENTYSDVYDRQVSLTDDELQYFETKTALIMDALNLSVPVFNRDHEKLHGKSKEALGQFHTDAINDPAADCFITIDNYFIHECYDCEILGLTRIEPQSLEDVLCHELAHMQKFRHGKGHTTLMESYLSSLEANSQYQQMSSMLRITHETRVEWTSKHGTGTDLCGQCIYASEELVRRIRNELGVEAVTKEGWCRFDDDYYGSDRPWDPHTWVEIPSLGLYIDITADQFNPGMYSENEFPCVVFQKGLPAAMTYEEPSWDEFEMEMEEKSVHDLIHDAYCRSAAISRLVCNQKESDRSR